MVNTEQTIVHYRRINRIDKLRRQSFIIMLNSLFFSRHANSTFRSAKYTATLFLRCNNKTSWQQKYSEQDDIFILCPSEVAKNTIHRVVKKNI